MKIQSSQSMMLKCDFPFNFQSARTQNALCVNFFWLTPLGRSLSRSSHEKRSRSHKKGLLQNCGTYLNGPRVVEPWPKQFLSGRSRSQTYGSGSGSDLKRCIQKPCHFQILLTDQNMYFFRSEPEPWSRRSRSHRFLGALEPEPAKCDGSATLYGPIYGKKLYKIRSGVRAGIGAEILLEA